MAKGKKHHRSRLHPPRQIEVAVANGKTTPTACCESGITEQIYYRWRKEYGGLKVDQARRLKELEQENAKLKRLVAELSLDKQILEGHRLGETSKPGTAALRGGPCASSMGRVSDMRASWFISHAARSATSRHSGTTKTR